MSPGGPVTYCSVRLGTGNVEAAGLTRDALQVELVRCLPRLRNYLQRHIPAGLRPTLSAEDLLQEVWTAAYRTVEHFRGAGVDAIDRWLNTLAHAKLIDAVRAARCLKRGGDRRYVQWPATRVSSYGGVVRWLKSPQRTPSGTVHLADTAQRILMALAQLSERQRRAVELRYLEGVSRPGIARELDTTERAVKALLERGLERLRDALGSEAKYFTDADPPGEVQGHASI
jgi:RNA polymerase sigma-70 factor, ECF subfamily